MVNDAVRTGITKEGRTGPGASARCAIPFASMVTGRKVDDIRHQNAKQNPRVEKLEEARGAPKTYHVQAHGAPLLDLRPGRSSGCMRTGLQARSLLLT
jgi:hypothetical protein